MRTLIRRLDRARPFAPVILRVVIGVLFLKHGLDKFDAGISMVEGAFNMWGVPAPGLTAPFTAGIEVVAGIALIVGVGTRVAALALAGVMAGAIFYVKADLGIISSTPMPGAEIDLALIAGLVALVILGPGRFSLDQQMGIESPA